METVMTYREWEIIRKRKQIKKIRRIIRKATRNLPQKLCGIIMVAIGVIWFSIEREITFTMFFVALGMFLSLTKERIIVFNTTK